MDAPKVAIIFVAVLASILEIIDSSIVNVALPSMMGNLGATLEDVSFVITGYAIANAVVLPVSAWLGERIGRRRYYLGCIAAFTFTSVLCGIAPNLFTLTLFRIFQGLAGGALLPTSQTLIFEQFPKEKAGMAGAIFGMSVMLGPTLGPVMGGYLTDHFGWRSIFNINLPLGIIAIVVGLTCIFDRKKSEEELSRTAKSDLDYVGLALLFAGIGCLQFVLERGQADDWFSSRAIVINTLITVICLPTFVWWELKVKNPIINVRLFKLSIVTNGVLLMMCVGFFLYGVVFILPIFLTRSFHYTATQIGVMFIPGSILTAFMMPFIGKQLQAGRSSKVLIAVGLISVELFLFANTFFSSLTSNSTILNALYLRGFGLAFLFVPINSTILGQFKGPSLGAVAGLLNLSRQIGGSIGIALIATLLAHTGNQNYLDLSSKVSLLNPQTQASYAQTVNSMGLKMSDEKGFSKEDNSALKAIYFRIQNQAFMMSYLQLIYIMMIIFALSFIPLSLIRMKRKSSDVALDAAH